MWFASADLWAYLPQPTVLNGVTEFEPVTLSLWVIQNHNFISSWENRLHYRTPKSHALRVAKLSFEPSSAPIRKREEVGGGWESMLTKGQDLGLQSGPTLLWFSCLSLSYVACVAFGNLDTGKHFWVQSVVLVGTIAVPPMHFLTFSHSSTGRVTTEPPFDHLYLSSLF